MPSARVRSALVAVLALAAFTLTGRLVSSPEPSPVVQEIAAPVRAADSDREGADDTNGVQDIYLR